MTERTNCGQIGAQHSINTAHADSLLKWEYIPLKWLNNTAFFFHLNVAWYYSACKTLNSYIEVLSVCEDSLFKWGDVVGIR